jgi:hypothetical protein
LVLDLRVYAQHAILLLTLVILNLTYLNKEEKSVGRGATPT